MTFMMYLYNIIQTIELSRSFLDTASLILINLCNKFDINIEKAYSHYLNIEENPMFEDDKFKSILYNNQN